MIIFTKNKEMIAEKLAVWGNAELPSELLSISQAVSKRHATFWTCMDYIDFKSAAIKLVHVPDNQSYVIPIKELHTMSSSILFRYVGSIEAQRHRIKKTLKLLQEYKGAIINNPKVIEYGMRKDYLLTLQQHSYPVIQTQIYPLGVSKSTILQHLDKKIEWIIKPVTGELSNSVNFLDQVDDDWLREREHIVGGWVVQPFMKEIWQGEIQMRFINDENILNLKKICKQTGHKLPDQSDRFWERFSPCSRLLSLARSLKKFFEHELKLGKIHCCRFDFIPGQSGFKILECEMVNPGMGYFNLSKEERIMTSNKLLDGIGLV